MSPAVALAITGVVTFALALAVPIQVSATGQSPRASGSIHGHDVVEAVAAPERDATQFGAYDLLEEPVVAFVAPTPPPPPPAPTALAVQAPPVTSGGAIVIASWYGPGFYGNRTACGQLYTPEIIGVAHRTLPCGTSVEIRFRDRTVVVPVIDRGPFIAGRTLDLSNATRHALACTDLCTVWMQVR